MVWEVPPGKKVIMTDEILTRMHKIQLEILLEVDRICKKYNILYCVSDGTALGAVRHQGFIPWDDDVDITMLRDQYDRFCGICPKELDHERFFWQTVETDPGYRWTHGKMRRKGTQYVRSKQEHMTNVTGVFCDILPVDDRPDNNFLQSIQQVICMYLRLALWSPVGAVWETNTLKRSCYRVISKIPRDIIYNLFLKTATYYNKKGYKRCAYYCALDNSKFNHDGFLKRWFLEMQDIYFEQHTVPVSKDVAGYLKFAYGDYMSLPPADKRVGNAPASLIELPD